MSLLQILQQGIQAKERAQQSSIEAGLRRLQIGKEEALQRERFSFEAESDSLNKQHDLLVLARKLDSDSMTLNQEQAYQTKREEDAQSHEMTMWKGDLALDLKTTREGYQADADKLAQEQAFETSETEKTYERQQYKDALLEMQRREGIFDENQNKNYTDADAMQSEIMAGWAGQMPTLVTSDDANTIRENFKDTFEEAGVADYNALGSTLFNAMVTAQAKEGTATSYQATQKVMELLYDQTQTAQLKGDVKHTARAKNIIAAFDALGFDTSENFVNEMKVFQHNEKTKQNILDEKDERTSKRLTGETEEEYWVRRFETQRETSIKRPTRENLDKQKALNEMIELATIADDIKSEKAWEARLLSSKDKKTIATSSDLSFRSWQTRADLRTKADDNFKKVMGEVGEANTYAVDNMLARAVQDVVSQINKDKNKSSTATNKSVISGKYGSPSITPIEVKEKKTIIVGDALGFTSAASPLYGDGLRNDWTQTWENDYARSIITHPNFLTEFKKHQNDLLTFVDTPHKFDWQKITSYFKSPSAKTDLDTVAKRRLFVVKAIEEGDLFLSKLMNSKHSWQKAVDARGLERESWDIYKKVIRKK
jgi:hypothetical protein